MNIMIKPKIYIFDCEIYQNYFGVIFKDPKSKEIKEFIIFEERNDFGKLIQFIDTPNIWLVGYNNYNFDNQLLNYMQKKAGEYIITSTDSNTICSDVYNLAKLIIDNNDNYSEYKYRLSFNSIDLMKAGNLQHKSLKLVAVSLKWHKIQELPIHWGNKIKEEEVDLLRKYNLNDVEITEVLYNLLLDKLKLRYRISEKYKVDVYSESDSGIANKILEKFYSDASGMSTYEFKSMRTKRPRIPFNDIIFNKIEFQSKELQTLHEDMIGQVYYESLPFFKKSVRFDNIEYQLGVGGLHSVDQPKIFESTDKIKIIDADVTSYYPSLMINYRLYPKHLGEVFIHKYREILDRRIEAKHNGLDDESDALKIVLNSTFGKTIFKNHWLYDPLVGYKITINGQLFLLMLIEKLVLNGFKIISANTDGIIALVETDKEELYYKLCKEWEYETSFNLEYTKYKKYIRRDVNNYITIKENDKIKQKGIFHTDLDLKKGFDKPIVSIALYEFFINNKSIKETILNHKDIYDFCTSKKTDSKFTNEFHYLKDNKHIIEKLQHIVRFYVSKEGGTLYKRSGELPKNGVFMSEYTDVISSSLISYCVGKYVTIFNDYIHKDNILDYNIDYSYYINETQKIIDQIINPQLTLF